MSRTYTIEIDCIRGDFTYSVNDLWLHHGDNVKWVCKDPKAHFAVHIGWNSPFNKCRYRATPGESIEVNVPPNALPGKYEYMVAVFDGNDIWTDDPNFIIRG